MTRRTNRPSRDTLISLYTREGLTDGQIARRFKVNASTVYRWKRHYGIEVKYAQRFTVRLVKGGD